MERLPKVEGKIVKIYPDEIPFAEGLKEYVRFICKNGKYVTQESLRNLEEQLPPDRFLRAHKSYIVSKGKVQSIMGNLLEIQSHKNPHQPGPTGASGAGHLQRRCCRTQKIMAGRRFSAED